MRSALKQCRYRRNSNTQVMWDEIPSKNTVPIYKYRGGFGIFQKIGKIIRINRFVDLKGTIARQMQIISHGRKNKQKHLPRINTEKHGRKKKTEAETRKRHTHTHNSEPEASATVAHSIGAGLKGSNGVVAEGFPIATTLSLNKLI